MEKCLSVACMLYFFCANVILSTTYRFLCKIAIKCQKGNLYVRNIENRIAKTVIVYWQKQKDSGDG